MAVISRPPVRRHARRASLVRLVATYAVLLALSGVGAACARPDPTGRDAAAGLLVLAGDVGAATLTVHDGETLNGRDVPLPGRATSWIATGRGNALAANLIDGSVHVSDPLRGDGEIGWRRVRATTVSGRPPDGPLHFASWDSDGGAFAVVTANWSDGDGLQVVIVDPSLEQGAVFPLDAIPVAAPPAWLDADRVAVVTGPPRRPEVTILDVTNGGTKRGPTGVTLVAVSVDGSTSAIVPRDGTIEIFATDSWLDGGPSEARIRTPSGATRPSALALDVRGTRLAVVWTDATGEPVGVSVYSRSTDWDRVASIRLGSVVGATVAWLR